MTDDQVVDAMRTFLPRIGANANKRIIIGELIGWLRSLGLNARRPDYRSSLYDMMVHDCTPPLVIEVMQNGRSKQVGQAVVNLYSYAFNQERGHSLCAVFNGVVTDATHLRMMQLLDIKYVYRDGALL